MRLLAEDAVVRVADGNGDYAEGVAVSHVRFARTQSVLDEGHRSADAGAGKVYVDALTLIEAVLPKVSYEVGVAALDGGECDLGDAVAVIDSSRTPEWRLKARVVKRVRTFGDTVVCRVTIGTVQPVDYAVTSSLAADVAALQDDVAGNARFAHYSNLSVATSTTYVNDTVTEAIDDLDELADLDF